MEAGKFRPSLLPVSSLTISWSRKILNRGRITVAALTAGVSTSPTKIIQLQTRLFPPRPGFSPPIPLSPFVISTWRITSYNMYKHTPLATSSLIVPKTLAVFLETPSGKERKKVIGPNCSYTEGCVSSSFGVCSFCSRLPIHPGFGEHPHPDERHTQT